MFVSEQQAFTLVRFSLHSWILIKVRTENNQDSKKSTAWGSHRTDIGSADFHFVWMFTFQYWSKELNKCTKFFMKYFWLKILKLLLKTAALFVQIKGCIDASCSDIAIWSLWIIYSLQWKFKKQVLRLIFPSILS